MLKQDQWHTLCRVEAPEGKAHTAGLDEFRSRRFKGHAFSFFLKCTDGCWHDGEHSIYDARHMYVVFPRSRVETYQPAYGIDRT
ncbi:hypothetical protein ACVWZV_001493 [Bradyrhizobium sp. GM5.1]